jgi:hypothetical protein
VDDVLQCLVVSVPVGGCAVARADAPPAPSVCLVGFVGFVAPRLCRACAAFAYRDPSSISRHFHPVTPLRVPKAFDGKRAGRGIDPHRTIGVAAREHDMTRYVTRVHGRMRMMKAIQIAYPLNVLRAKSNITQYHDF